MRRITLSAATLAVITLLVCACAPQAQVVSPTQNVGPERTSVLVIYHTPTPTPPAPEAAPAFSPTPDMDPDFYDGGLTISFDSVGAVTQLRQGQSFLLSLGDSYTWKVELEPQGLISRNMKITPERGEQGVFIAREQGKVSLRAIGSPTCRQSQPPCERPDVLFVTLFEIK